MSTDINLKPSFWRMFLVLEKPAAMINLSFEYPMVFEA
jgi:hypothetical protein